MVLYSASHFIQISLWYSLSNKIAKSKGLYTFNFKNTHISPKEAVVL